MRNLIARFLAVFIPRDDPENDPEPGGTPPTPDADPNAGGSPGARSDMDLAAQLEAANRRYAELEQRIQDEVMARVEAGLSALVPETGFTEPTPQPRSVPRQPQQVSEDDEFTDPEAEIRGADPSREIQDLRQRVFEIQVDREADALNTQLNALSAKYPSADRRFVLNELARPGRTVNLEALVRFSHEREEAIFKKRYAEERAREVETARSASAPPIPSRPAGTPVGASEKRGYDRKSVVQHFIQSAKELGWGEGG